MANDPPRIGSGKGRGGEEPRESLPHLVEVVPDFEQLSPFYQRPNSAPPGGDPARPPPAITGELERHPEFPPIGVPSEPPLPPLRASVIRTHPGAGLRLPYQNPFELSLDPRPSRVIVSDERPRPPLPSRRETGVDIPTRSPILPSRPRRVSESRPTERTHYDPVHDTPRRRRGSRGQQLPPIDVGSREGLRAPPYQPLPPLRTGGAPPAAAYPQPSPRFVPYPHDRPPYEGTSSRRRHSPTLPRDIHAPRSAHTSPTLGRDYPYEKYQTYHSGFLSGTRRPSLEGVFMEERETLRPESVVYVPPLPYSSSYPPSLPYEYAGGRGGYHQHDPYHGYLEYPPDRRLSRQDPGELVPPMVVPERSAYRAPLRRPPTPPNNRVQATPHAGGLPAGTPGKRRGNLPKESKEKLKQWLSRHVEHPYPTEDEKKELAAEAGMTMGQINNWFINARRRTLPRFPGRQSPSQARSLRRRPGDT